jgi:enterochelin esterase-like enzyme
VPASPWGGLLARWTLVLPPVLFAVAVGAVGIFRYVDNFWLYRGFPAPKEPAYVSVQGTKETISVASAALGGGHQQVIVYLPPGYASHPTRRYPVFYLLHGFPGFPEQFLLTGQMGVHLDALVAKKRIRPLILVMPFGSTGTFTDKEWVNGVRPNEGWETFVARDVVRAIDARYRTIATGAGRALGGLSEGGYAALNIALHHPAEFAVIESWSGYQVADNIRSIFGGRKDLLAYNSPSAHVVRVAAALRRHHVYIWFYSGTNDRLHSQNEAFAAQLTALGISHEFFLVRGGHNWAIWRSQAERALTVAGTRLAHG